MVPTNQKYLEREILQGKSIDHIILLYSKAINSLKIVKNISEEGINTPEKAKTKAEALTKAIDILVYLEAILDFEKGKEIAKNLKDIYDILIDELIRFNFTQDLKIINDSIEILEKLKLSWIDLKKGMSKPVNQSSSVLEIRP